MHTHMYVELREMYMNPKDAAGQGLEQTLFCLLRISAQETCFSKLWWELAVPLYPGLRTPTPPDGAVKKAESQLFFLFHDCSHALSYSYFSRHKCNYTMNLFSLPVLIQSVLETRLLGTPVIRGS